MEFTYQVDAAIVPNITAELAEHNARADRKFASEEELLRFHLDEVVRQWIGKHKRLPPAPPPAPAVPLEVTRRQGMQALINTNRLQLVQPCIDLIADAAQRATMQNEWDNSQTFQRQRPSLILLATTPAPNGLGMSLQDLDDLFVLAATL